MTETRHGIQSGEEVPLALFSPRARTSPPTYRDHRDDGHRAGWHACSRYETDDLAVLMITVPS
ncbi:hypothetical protein ACI8AG_01245 [Blastococcus sp. SYSU DS0552]